MTIIESARRATITRIARGLAVACLGIGATGLLAPADAFAAESACDVRVAQATLRALGFDPGPVDGLWGNATATAVGAYQSANDLDASQALDSATCVALELERSVGAPYQEFLEPTAAASDTTKHENYLVRRTWCGEETVRVECTPGNMLMVAGNMVPCGSTLKSFRDEIGGGMVIPSVHEGAENPCRSLDDFCIWAETVYDDAFAKTCDGRAALSEEVCQEKLLRVCK